MLFLGTDCALLCTACAFLCTAGALLCLYRTRRHNLICLSQVLTKSHQAEAQAKQQSEIQMKGIEEGEKVQQDVLLNVTNTVQDAKTKSVQMEVALTILTIPCSLCLTRTVPHSHRLTLALTVLTHIMLTLAVAMFSWLTLTMPMFSWRTLTVHLLLLNFFSLSTHSHCPYVLMIIVLTLPVRHSHCAPALPVLRLTLFSG